MPFNIGCFLLFGFLLLAITVLLRAAVFRPKPQKEVPRQEISFDRDAAVFALQQLVRCRTVSCTDPALEDEEEFEKFRALLPQLYPEVFRVCTVQRFPGRALLFRWPGKLPGDPTVLMAHYDVVSVEEESWEKPPFAGIIEDGVLWGRGTLDTKVTLNGILSAACHLITKGFQPQRDIYFAFSGGEEVNGPGAKHIAGWFLSEKITPALVVDEGGAVVENVFPGVKAPCGMIGIAEKGMMNVRYTVRSCGGHASAPPSKSPIPTLAETCRRIGKHPFPMHITKPAAQMFDTLGRHAGFGLKLVFANLWLFRPVLDLICRRGGGELNALVRTTTAFTQMAGSTGRNVLPAEAHLISNMRLSPMDTVEGAAAHLRKAVKDPAVEIEVLESFPPSPVSETGCESWDKVARAVSHTWPGCIVTPYLMVQCSDSRHYGKLSNHVYRFSAMDLTGEERKTIHGNNEKIRLETVGRAVEFYIRLIGQC